MGYSFSVRSRARMSGIDDRLIEIAQRALELSKVDFGIPAFGGLRTLEEQALLYANGKSNADGVAQKSYHQSGKALDVYAYVNGKASWDKCDLAMVATAMLQAAAELEIPLEWGGLWKNFEDYPHFQIPRGS